MVRIEYEIEDITHAFSGRVGLASLPVAATRRSLVLTLVAALGAFVNLKNENDYCFYCFAFGERKLNV